MTFLLLKRDGGKAVAAWAGVFIFWLLLTRDFHPTITIAVLATLSLVVTFAAALYLNIHVLLPRYARRSWWLYGIMLLATIAILDCAVVLLIQWIYDVLWGPDPLRFGFLTNFAYDGIGIIVHLVGGMLIVRGYRRLQRRRSRIADTQPSHYSS